MRLNNSYQIIFFHKLSFFLVSAIWRELSSFWNICGALNVSFFLDKYLSYQIFSYVNISQLLGICDYHNTLELYCTCIKCWNLLTLQEFYVCLLSTSFIFLFHVYINRCIYQNNMANWLVYSIVIQKQQNKIC